MSLALTVSQPTGVDATFWALNSLYLDALAHLGVINMDGYLDATAHTDGKSPLVTQSINVTFVPTTVIPGISVMEALYVKIQLDPFFSGAVYTDDGF